MHFSSLKGTLKRYLTTVIGERETANIRIVERQAFL